ncbi:MAG: UbiX family flavin prenyltransferase [Parvibaculum sp.]
MSQNKRLIVGISGASGVIYGVRLLEILKSLKIESHLVMTKAAELTLGHETGMHIRDVEALAHTRYQPTDIGAAIASGSFKTLGMIVAPCSVRSMSEIATGVTSGLLTRAADVVLKERRKLVLMVRETPLHTGHLRTMTHLSEIGAIIAPSMPAFYAEPQSIDDIVTQSVARLLDLFDIDAGQTRRWGEDLKGGKRRPIKPGAVKSGTPKAIKPAKPGKPTKH